MPNNIVTVEVKGLDELEAKLYDLPTKFARRAMREAIKPAIDIWKQEIQAGASKFTKYATGWMASHVDTRITTSSRDEAGTGMVGFTKQQNPSRQQKHVPSASDEARFNELGTVNAPAKPFIRPAFESKAPAVLALFTEKLKLILDEVFHA